ncbi:IS66 family transposase [Sulfitobacter profundi]|uniref:Transposase n=1 Tax=Sulfitobacter profundi TaxID=2679961 RepID=A0ABW1Z388_9RHOB
MDAVEAQRRLESIVSELRREKFGQRPEKLDPEQCNLPLEDVELVQGVLDVPQEKARRALKGQDAAEKGAPNRNSGFWSPGAVVQAHAPELVAPGRHLPFYRQEEICTRQRITLDRATLGIWVGRACLHLRPIADHLKELSRCPLI